MIPKIENFSDGYWRTFLYVVPYLKDEKQVGTINKRMYDELLENGIEEGEDVYVSTDMSYSKTLLTEGSEELPYHQIELPDDYIEDIKGVENPPSPIPFFVHKKDPSILVEDVTE